MIAQRFRVNSVVIVRLLRFDFTSMAIARRLSGECKAIARRLSGECKAIAQRLSGECKAIAWQLYNDCNRFFRDRVFMQQFYRVFKTLCNDYVAIAPRSCSDFDAFA
jgi:hypothetical protein